MGYLDIDEILSEQENINVMLNNDAYDLATLLTKKDAKKNTDMNVELLPNQDLDDSIHSVTSTSSDLVEDDEDDEDDNKKLNSTNIQAKTKLNMPYWLAKELGKKHFVVVEFPSWMKVLESCKADWASVNINSITQHFYNFGQDLSYYIFNKNKFSEEREELAERLSKNVFEAFVKRFPLILQHSISASTENNSQIVRMLSVLEERLYRTGQTAQDEYANWKVNGVGLSIVKQSILMKQEATTQYIVPASAQKPTQPVDEEGTQQQARKRRKNNDGSIRATAK
ncbi:DNA replication complex GINS protein [Acrasis kona]|uniref:DNA replication complex GINS protein n=1 Tax=Acrasis kona TaxID=1008807 RepID=A0AAW2Z3T1_9EUKA